MHVHYHYLSETQPFVDKLFEAIDNKNYLPQPEPPSTLIKVEKDEQKKDEVLLSGKLFLKYCCCITHEYNSTTRYKVPLIYMAIKNIYTKVITKLLLLYLDKPRR